MRREPRAESGHEQDRVVSRKISTMRDVVDFLMASQVIRIPRSIGAWDTAEEGVEELVGKTLQTGQCGKIVLDLSEVQFLRPYSVLMLACASRYLSQVAEDRIEIVNIPHDIHAYLERAKFFEVGGAWLYTDQILPSHAKLTENPHSNRILPMMFIWGEEDLYKIIEAVRSIFSTWLGFPSDILDNLIGVTAELCNNVREHSRDPEGGLVLAQSYRKKDHFEVVLSVADMGVGVPKSLESRFGDRASTAAEFIRLALQGYSSRGEGKGGNGLPTVCDVVTKYGGSVLLRSLDGGVKVGRDVDKASNSLLFFPGTQLQVELRSG